MMSEGQQKVNLFVVGAMKAGTTSFVDWLKTHPQIYIPPIKEPNYFVEEISKQLYQPSRFFDLAGYFKKDFPTELHIANLSSSEQYRKLYSLAERQKYRVDASTMYLHAPGTASRIADYNQQARILILLRDPYKRMYSHYKMLVGLSRETRTFQHVVQEEVAAYHAGNLPWDSLLNMSCYKSTIALYKQNFSQVMVINLKQLINNRPDMGIRLQAFLGLDSPMEGTLPHDNQSRLPISGKFFYYLNRMGVKDLFSLLFSSRFKRALYRILSKEPTATPELSSELRLELEAIFKLESPGESS